MQRTTMCEFARSIYSDLSTRDTNGRSLGTAISARAARKPCRFQTMTGFSFGWTVSSTFAISGRSEISASTRAKITESDQSVIFKGNNLPLIVTWAERDALTKTSASDQIISTRFENPCLATDLSDARLKIVSNRWRGLQSACFQQFIALFSSRTDLRGVEPTGLRGQNRRPGFGFYADGRPVYRYYSHARFDRGGIGTQQLPNLIIGRNAMINERLKHVSGHNG